MHRIHSVRFLLRLLLCHQPANKLPDNAVDAQQRTLAIGVGVGVGLFVLFLVIAIWFFWRRSKKRKQRMNENAQRMNEQTYFARLQPDMHHRYGQPTYDQQTYGQPSQPSQERRGEEVDGLAYKTEMESRHRSNQYQEMNAHSANTPHQGGQVVEAQEKTDPQEMPLSYRQHPPQEMPGEGRR